MIDTGGQNSERGYSFISLGKLVAMIIIAAAIYVIMIFLDNWETVITALSGIPWWWVLPAMMILSFTNYLFRYAKWQYYLQRIDVHFSHADSFSIFLAGFTLTVSPGKIGEAIKGYFCRDVDGTPVAKTVPVVVSERVTDLLAMVILAAFSFLFLFTAENQILLVLGVGGAVVLGALVLTNKAFYNRILKRMISFGPLKRFQDSIDVIEDTMVRTLSPRPMMVGVLLSVPGWFMECLELWLLLSLMSGGVLPSFAPASLLLLIQATFIHASASAIGAVVLVAPGGLGAYEIYARGVMEVFGLAAIATASILLIRFVTLWFSVIVGFMALAVVTQRNRKRQSLVIQKSRVDEG